MTRRVDILLITLFALLLSSGIIQPWPVSSVRADTIEDRIKSDLARITWEEYGGSAFEAVFKESLTDDRPLQYLAEGKFISFKPISGLSATRRLTLDHRAAYDDALAPGISLEMVVSRDHWKKLVKIDSFAALGDIKGRATIDFMFEVESDFDIPLGENKKPRIQLGEHSYIEVAKAWDSGVLDNDIPIKSYFIKGGDSLYLVKQIPVPWLRKATFPVWSDLDISWGIASEFEAGVTMHVQCCEIDTDKFVVAYMDLTDGNAGKARVASVAANDTITWGAINEFCGDVSIGGQLGVCKLDTDKFVVVYADGGNADDGYARVGVVAGVTIAYGAAVEFENSDVQYPSCCQIDTDKFAIAYNDETAGDLGTVCVCSVAVDVITPGAGVVFEGQLNPSRCAQLDTNKFVAFYVDRGDGFKGKACAFTVALLVPTAGAIKEIEPAHVVQVDCTEVDTDKFLIAWAESDGTDTNMEICTVAVTTITEGAEVELESTQTDTLGLAMMNATYLIVGYADTGDGDIGITRHCNYTGTTITLGDKETFHDAATNYIDICLISPGKVAAVYQDDADVGNIGEARCGHEPFPGHPDDLQAYPSSDGVSLVWVKGDDTNKTLVRYKIGAYPDNVTDGTELYEGVSSSVLHEGVGIGINYYYRAWGERAGNYSAAYVNATTTTFAAGAGAETPDAPTTPGDWWAVTDYTGLDGWFFYPVMNDFADVYGLPRNTFWFIAVLLFIMSIGLIIFSVAHEPTVSIICVGIMIVTAAAATLLPLWLIAAYGVPVASVFFVKTRI